MNTYVDDCYTVIITKSNTIWKLVKEYIKKMNQYYIDNQLKMNVKKTMVMIITDKQEEKDNTIIVDGNITRTSKMYDPHFTGASLASVGFTTLVLNWLHWLR